MAEQTNDSDIIAIINDIFSLALTRQASDIHIEPKESTMDFRLRVDGEFTERKTYPLDVHQPIITRIKMLADLKIDETRLPQDGKASFKIQEENIDLRISVLPTVYGEKICIRILKSASIKDDLEELGVLDYQMKRIDEAIKKSFGIILVSGPTGAGKTTSLYAMINKFDPLKFNISTLEDPVEYKMKDVIQSQIRKDIGFDFADGLRTLVRQDPDIILVGEIRDEITAKLAIESALTGHIVFSTIHTNSASATIQRLVNMGVETYLLPSALRMVMAQRLVRRICSNCEEVYRPHENVIKQIVAEVGEIIKIDTEKLMLYRGKGCNKCGNTGYKGRVGIFEMLPVSQKISEMIVEEVSSSILEQQAIKEGMLTMKKDGLLKVIMGITTLEEITTAIN